MSRRDFARIIDSTPMRTASLGVPFGFFVFSFPSSPTFLLLSLDLPCPPFVFRPSIFWPLFSHNLRRCAEFACIFQFMALDWCMRAAWSATTKRTADHADFAHGQGTARAELSAGPASFRGDCSQTLTCCFPFSRCRCDQSAPAAGRLPRRQLFPHGHQHSEERGSPGTLQRDDAGNCPRNHLRRYGKLMEIINPKGLDAFVAELGTNLGPSLRAPLTWTFLSHALIPRVTKHAYLLRFTVARLITAQPASIFSCDSSIPCALSLSPCRRAHQSVSAHQGSSRGKFARQLFGAEDHGRHGQRSSCCRHHQPDRPHQDKRAIGLWQGLDRRSHWGRPPRRSDRPVEGHNAVDGAVETLRDAADEGAPRASFARAAVMKRPELPSI